MRIRIWTTLSLLSLLAASCSQQDEPGRERTSPLEVTIGSEPGLNIDLRTALEDDGFSIRWVKGDRIALWALNSAGEAQLSAVPFTLYSFDETYRSAKFTGTVDPMDEVSYTYCALSPLPASTEGTKGVYSIPQVQDGSYHGEYDVMAAMPVTGGALVAGDNSESVNLVFGHKVHLLKIRIPENRLGQPITELRLTFPVPVAGTLKVDAADPDAAPELTDGSHTLTLEFPTPVDAGAVVYATIAPVVLDATVPVALTAICEEGESKTIRIPGKDFAAGHSTPIAFTVPEMGLRYTKLLFSLAGTGEETLGERIERFTVTGPEGCDLGGGVNSRTFEIDAAGKYEIVFRDGIPDGISGQPFTVTFESVNALVSDTFKMDELVPEKENTIAAFGVPYLMEENFDNVQTYSDNEGTTGVNDPDAIWIPGLSGWSAARTGGSAGQSVRIVGHREGGMWVFADYEARMDSAPLSGLKEGADVQVRISFDYSGSTNKGASKLKYGTSTSQGLISGANASVESQAGNVTTNTNGSYGNVNQSATPFTANATNRTRLTWVAYGSDGGFSGSYFYYVYIDNVKVSIVQ